MNMLCSRVAFSYNLADIALMKSLCEDAGIAVFDINMSSQLSFGGADSGYYLDVPRDAAEQAKTTLTGTDYEKYIIA